MTTFGRRYILVLLGFFICYFGIGQNCSQYIIDDENGYASRDKYVSSISLPNNQKYVYVTYEELNSDVEPGHLLIDSNNEILQKKKSKDYSLQMPISDITTLLHQGHIYVIGKIIPEPEGNIRLLQLSLDLDIINATTFDLPTGSVAGLQLNSIHENEIAFSYYNAVNNEFVLTRLDNEGTVLNSLEISFDSNIHQYQIKCSPQGIAYATFDLLEGLKIYRIDESAEEVFYQANTSSALYASDHIVVQESKHLIAYYEEIQEGPDLHRESRLLQMDESGQILWNRVIGDTLSISNSIGDITVVGNKVFIIGYTYVDEDFDVFFQTVDTDISPIKRVYSTGQNDIPSKMITLPNNQFGIIGFSALPGYYSNAFVLTIDDSGAVSNTYVEYGGFDEREPEYFDIIYNSGQFAIDIIGSYYIYDRPQLPFYSFKSDVVIQSIWLDNFEPSNQTTITGEGIGKNQVKWLAEDSEGNVYLAGFRQMGFAEAGCSACVLLNTPYLYKYNSTGDLLWKDFFDPTNDNFNTPPSFLKIDSEDNAWMVTEAFTQTGQLAQILHYDPDGNITWIYEIMDNGYMIDFSLDSEDRAWILYSNIGQIYLDVIDNKGSKISKTSIGPDEITNVQMLIAEETENPFSILIYTDLQAASHIIQKVKDGQIAWSTTVPLEFTTPIYTAQPDYVREQTELAIADIEKIFTINTDNGDVTNNFPLENPLFDPETFDQEILFTLKVKDEYTIITNQRLVKYDLSGEKISDTTLPLEYGYHYTESENNFLLAREDATMLFSDFSLEQYELIENPDCFAVDGLENLNFQTSNSIYDFGSNLFIGSKKIGMLGELYRPSLIGNPVRRYNAYAPLAATFDVETISSNQEVLDAPLQTIKIFPNPVSASSITVESHKDFVGSKTLTIHNIVGEKIIESHWPSGQARLHVDLPVRVRDNDGIYLITVSNETRAVVEKLIINTK